MIYIAILLTCYNRKLLTLACLDSLRDTLAESGSNVSISVFLTDDGCTDGTADGVLSRNYPFPVTICQGTGSLFWNAGMNLSWRAAIAAGGFDGYLWLNDDVVLKSELWSELAGADEYAESKYGQKGIYIGSTCNAETGAFTYGGFVFTDKLLLLDSFVIPDGHSFQECECALGNILYVSRNVVERMGVLYDGYVHGGGDHDYTYLAHKKGFPLLVLPDYCGVCENDHKPKKNTMVLSKRLFDRNNPLWRRYKNARIFNRRCFPWRYPFVVVIGFAKILCPEMIKKIRLTLRTRK